VKLPLFKAKCLNPKCENEIIKNRPIKQCSICGGDKLQHYNP